jgi:hypothetical protein
MKRSMKLAVILALTSLFWLMPAQAQDNDGIATTVIITPKAGQADDLVKAITEYHHYVAQFDGHFEYTWYEILTGPNTGKYAARSGGHNWSDFDAVHDWQDQADEMFAQNVAPHIDNAKNMMTEEMSDYMNWPDSFDGYTHFNLENWYIRGGQRGAFQKGLKQIVDTLKEGGYPGYFGFYSVASGGHGGQVQLVSGHKGWSDMTDKSPSFMDLMGKKLGGEEQVQAFLVEWGATFKSGDNWTVRLMPEASDYGN